MTSWRIDPGGVESVLNLVCQRAGDLSTSINSMWGDLERAASSSGSQIVVQALSDFLAARAPELTEATRRINGAVNGAVAATRAYELGDHQMAADAHSLIANTASG
ncbi:hypothetical protein SAMN05892883_0209 [Jatrophihabitans sp. GAS493]|uniref:DUF6507 family protein n=1 Tax=Jatrophihabitans sp. GAS493 TaxID=1907575 RepID=UPI000BC08EE2|nr:DUF6507 family protein [Jatrophihabitans sp. GAS493]SOD70518.1 hypothetical protein SAMN05892883_0209 [Jatrophihabitans sp. GAS493]